MGVRVAGTTENAEPPGLLHAYFYSASSVTAIALGARLAGEPPTLIRPDPELEGRTRPSRATTRRFIPGALEYGFETSAG